MRQLHKLESLRLHARVPNVWMRAQVNTSTAALVGGAASLAAAVGRLQRLQQFELTYVPCLGGAAHHFSQLQGLTRLRLSDCGIDNSVVEALAPRLTGGC